MAEEPSVEPTQPTDLPFKELAPDPSLPPRPKLFSREAPKPKKQDPFSKDKKSNPFKRGIQQAKRRQTLLIVGLLIVGVVSLGYYFFIAGKARIVIQDTSSDITITLNNQPVKLEKNSEGYVISTFAGKYRLQIAKPNYVSYVQDIQIDRGQTLTVRPVFAFQPTSEQADTSTVDFVRPSLDGNSIFYLGDNRKTIYRMEIANQVKVPLTDDPLNAVTDVEWSSQPNVALITQSDGVYLREIPKYDYRNQTLVKLGGNDIISPIWDPLNPSRIAFAYYPASGERSLVFTDKRLSSLERKADLTPISNPKLIWSSDDHYIAIIGRSSDYAANNLWIYDTIDGSLKQITQGGNVTDASFSPSATTILYETRTNDPSNTLGTTLSLMQVDGSNKKPLNISGRVARTAWKDDSSFYLPSDKNSLILYNSKGNPDRVSFNFPDELSIKGMIYFSTSKTLIFYTDTSIYTVALAI